MANDLINNDKRNSDAEAAAPQSGTETKRPFDTSGVNWVPDFDEADPPYRNWWVAEEDERDKE